MALAWCWGWEMDISTAEFVTVTGCSTDHATNVATNTALSMQPPGGVGGGSVCAGFYTTTGRWATMALPTAAQVDKGWVVFSYMGRGGDLFDTGENNILKVQDGSTTVILVTANRGSPTSTATVKLYISGTLVGESSIKLACGSWAQIAVKFDASATGAAHTGSLYIDGVLAVASGDGGNPSAAYVIDEFSWYGAQESGDLAYHDHTFIWNSLSDTPNTATHYIDGIRPNGDTVTTNWTGGYADVDDGAAVDKATTSTSAAVLEMTTASPSTSYVAGSIAGVQITNYCVGAASAGLEDASVAIKHGSTSGTYTETNATAGATFATRMDVQNPDTTAAWTDGDLDGISTLYKAT